MTGRTIKAVLAAAAIVVSLVLPGSAQTPPSQQQLTIVSAWNECGDSLLKENRLITELTSSLKLNPPWRVVDAREPTKRAKLIDRLIVQYRRRIRLLEIIKRVDGPGS
jgi:hypothetical protein